MARLTPINKNAALVGGLAAQGSAFSKTVFGLNTTTAAGALLGTLTAPFGPGTVYTNVSGDAIIQFDTSTGRFTLGSGTLTAGETKSRKVRAVSGDGKREVAETFTFPISAASGGGGNPNPGTSVSAPSGFTFTGPYVPTISRATGNVFSTNYDKAARKALIAYTNTFWVDNTVGTVNGAGTEASPVSSIDLAIAMGNASAAPFRIKVRGSTSGAPRLYRYTTQATRSGQAAFNQAWRQAWTSQIPSQPMIIEPWADGELFDSAIETAALTFTATADANIWKANASNASFDYTNLDRFRAPRRLVVLLGSFADEAAIIAALNSFWTLNSGLSDLGGASYATGVLYRDTANSMTYVRTWDNRNPSGDTNLVLSSAGQNGARLSDVTAERRYVLEGLGMMGGSAAALYINGTTGIRPKLDHIACRFYGGGGAGALTVTGNSLAADGCDIVGVGSHAQGGTLDGFNYHGVCSFIEIGCGGDWNGHTTLLTNNGTTCHETCTGIRINGTYLNNQDRSIHDVDRIQTWHLGCTSGTRRGQDGQPQSAAYAVGDPTATQSAKMWLDACKIAYGPAGAPQYPTTVYTGDTIYYANLTFTPTTAPGSGTVAAYTP